MDSRAAKLALARKKLKDHQGKKVIFPPKDEEIIVTSEEVQQEEAVLTQNNNSDIGDNSQQITNEFKNQEELKTENKPMNVTEILISNKINLEIQLSELQTKLIELENNHIQTTQNFNISRKQIFDLERELKNLHDNYMNAQRDLQEKNNFIKELNDIKISNLDQINHLTEQLELTKTMLTAKETENASLQSQLCQVENQLDGVKLQLRQLTNGSSIKIYQNDNESQEANEMLLQKITLLEQQLKTSHKERDQISVHYEHYVAELNEQLKLVMKKNDEMAKEIQSLSTRESTLIEQISDMEIRLQNFSQMKRTVEMNTNNSVNVTELQQNYVEAQEKIKQLIFQYEDIKQKYIDSEAKIRELSEAKESKRSQDDISFTKLHADMTSDKIAAQRATEQNMKLKSDMQELEEAFIKMSKDKLELTEKIAAEKFLNRELTIKLAEVEERAKDMHIKIKAKDDEMIRLQNNLRYAEKELKGITNNLHEVEKEDVEHPEHVILETQHSEITRNTHDNEYCRPCKEDNVINETDNENDSLIIKNEDAMTKLQERFLKIMGEVADLSDEKHRLEHIILQLQNETDTICEYVALYQQQRSLLKKRDEERNTQIKIFQDACNKLHCQIKELSNLLIRFSEDKELSQYFLNDSRKNDLERVMNLISHLKSNCLIDPKHANSDLKNFYPCSCCSGKLIEV
ncbi:golgin subfamily A member 2-like [Plodia interpunctella]|uniref:golgin subfamily A member 2-like n=1 Tax=Plodia interpunctella TaxID=58824 RepID=UPI0023685530|nr:golgin subfamily A member 2-like [Plodia interpunctella]